MKRLLWKLYSATILILLLPIVVIESIIKGRSVKGDLKKWCAYWPANGWCCLNLEMNVEESNEREYV